jgi:hypothetical protein
MQSVLISSWNVHTKPPNSIKINTLFSKTLVPAPELVVLGFQELFTQQKGIKYINLIKGIYIYSDKRFIIY